MSVTAAQAIQGCRVLMQGSRVFATCLVVIVFIVIAPPPTWAQGVGDVSRGLDLTPSNPLGLPGTTGGLPRGSDTLNLSSRMFPEILPAIPGLEISYLHSFGQGVDSSRLLVEFVRPVRLNSTTTIYGEAHGLLHDFWSAEMWSEEGRLDLAIGGGVRTRLGANTIVGAHAFYDATHQRGQWRSSASVGALMATILPGDDAIDLAVNWYGASSTDPLIGLFRQAAKGSLDGTITYYHELWGGGPDLRLSVFGYSEDESQTTVHLRDRGYGGRIALASRDGMLRASYQYEHDSSLREVHTVGVNLNVGFRLENLLALQSPIENPTPIFSSPRNLDRWQNVSGGTERHLRKLTVGHSNCNWSDCGPCWDSIKRIYVAWASNNPYLPLSAWRSYITGGHAQGQICNNSCMACIYFGSWWNRCTGEDYCIDRKDFVGKSICTKYAIKWNTDPCCCVADSGR